MVGYGVWIVNWAWAGRRYNARPKNQRKAWQGRAKAE